MKKTIMIVVASTALFAGISNAQTNNDSIKKDDGIKTIFGNKKIKHGGYGALSIGYSQIDGKDAFVTGARGAWIIGHSFAIGLGGMGFSNNLYIDDDAGWMENEYSGGYGGLLLEPVIFPKFPVHLSLPVILGAGGVASDSDDFNHYASHAFLVAEPGAEIEINLIRFVRIAFGASYRFTSNIRFKGKQEYFLNGYSASLSLKIGKF